MLGQRTRIDQAQEESYNLRLLTPRPPMPTSTMSTQTQTEEDTTPLTNNVSTQTSPPLPLETTIPQPPLKVNSVSSTQTAAPPSMEATRIAPSPASDSQIHTPRKMGSDPEVEGARHRLTRTDARRQGEGEAHFESPVLPPNTLRAIPGIQGHRGIQ